MGFFESQNQAIDAAIPLAFKLHEINRSAAAAAAKLAQEKDQWDRAFLETKKKNAVDALSEKIKAGIPVADTDTQAAFGTNLPRQAFGAEMEGPSVEAIRAQLTPGLENLAITPRQATEEEMAVGPQMPRFDVSAQKIIQPVPMDLQKLAATINEKRLENEAAERRANETNQTQITAAEIAAGKGANLQRHTKQFEQNGKRMAQDYNFDPKSGIETPVGNPYPMATNVAGANITVNAGTQNQVDTLARGVIDGTIDPNAISKRGNLQGGVFTRVKELDPKFDLVAAGAGAKFQQSTATMQTKALLNSINPILDELDKAGRILDNTNVPLYNQAKNYLKEQTGDDTIVGFNNLRDDTIAEVERGLLGTGVLSDSKYMRALKNVNSAQSYPQLKAAIRNMRIVINARLEALHKGPNAKVVGPGASGESGAGANKVGRFTVEVE